MASVAHSVWAPANEKNDPSKASRPSGDSASSRGRGGARGRGGRGRGRGGYRGGKAGSISEAPGDSKPATESSTPGPAPQGPTQAATNTSTSPNAATSVPAPTNTNNNNNDSQSRQQRTQPQRKRSNVPPTIIVEPIQSTNDKTSKNNNNRKRGPKPPSRKSSLASTSARSDGEPSPVQSLAAPRTDLDSLVNRTRAMAMGSSVPPSPDMRSFTPTLTWADTENEDLPELDEAWVKKPATAPPTIPSIAEAESLAPHAPSVEVDAKRLSTSSVGSTQARETKEIPPHQQKKDKGKGRDNLRDRPRSNQPTPPPRSPYIPPVSAGHEPRPNDNSFRGGDSHFSPRGRGGFAYPRGMRGGPMQRPNNFHHHNAAPPPPPPPPVHVSAEPPAPPVVQEVTFASLNDPAPEDHQPPQKYGNHSPSHFNTFHSPGRGRHLNFNQGFSHQAYSPSNPTSPSSPPGHMRNPSSPHSSGHSRTHSRPVISIDGFAQISKVLGVPRGTPKGDAAILSSPPAAT